MELMRNENKSCYVYFFLCWPFRDKKDHLLDSIEPLTEDLLRTYELCTKATSMNGPICPSKKKADSQCWKGAYTVVSDSKGKINETVSLSFWLVVLPRVQQSF